MLPAGGEDRGPYPAILGETIKTQKISGNALREKLHNFAANFVVFIDLIVPQLLGYHKVNMRHISDR
jgi:hypothetical protein